MSTLFWSIGGVTFSLIQFRLFLYFFFISRVWLVFEFVEFVSFCLSNSLQHIIFVYCNIIRWPRWISDWDFMNTIHFEWIQKPFPNIRTKKATKKKNGLNKNLLIRWPKTRLKYQQSLKPLSLWRGSGFIFVLISLCVCMCVFGFGLTSRLWSPCSVAKVVRLNDDRLQFPPIKSLWHPRPLACNDPFSTNLLAKNVLKLMNYYLGTLHVLSPRVGSLNKGRTLWEEFD